MKSCGVGDTIESLLASAGAKQLVKLLSEIFETDCRCADRQKLLNEVFPYDSGTWRERLDSVLKRVNGEPPAKV